MIYAGIIITLLFLSLLCSVSYAIGFSDGIKRAGELDEEDDDPEGGSR